MNNNPLLLIGAILGLFASIPGHLRAEQVVKIDGSSTVYPITEAVAEEFQKATGTKVTVGISGTGGGFKKFVRGETDVQDASRPIKEEEVKAAKEGGVEYLELPIAYDALTVVVNSKNDWVGAIKVSDLKKIWEPEAQGKITKWNQVRPEWPDKEIKLYGAGSDSGTFDYFNEAINGDKANARADVQSSENDNVLVSCVAKDPNAMAYFGFAYYQANAQRLRSLPVVGTSGVAVAPSIKTAQNGSYAPLTRPLFIYVNDKEMRSNEAIRSFVSFTIGNGLRFVAEAGYIPLPADTYRIVESKLYLHILSTSFGGDLPVGLTIGEALRRSFDDTRKPEFR